MHRSSPRTPIIRHCSTARIAHTHSTCIEPLNATQRAAEQVTQAGSSTPRCTTSPNLPASRRSCSSSASPAMGALTAAVTISPTSDTQAPGLMLSSTASACTTFDAAADAFESCPATAASAGDMTCRSVVLCRVGCGAERAAGVCTVL
jgi:hypothetical protein